jgi:hypothetical protein
VSGTLARIGHRSTLSGHLQTEDLVFAIDPAFCQHGTKFGALWKVAHTSQMVSAA